MIRAVLDANVFASSLIQPKGPSGRIIKRFLVDKAFQVVTSADILQEVKRCLYYPRVRKRIRVSDDEIEAYIASVALIADTVQPSKAVLGVVEADPDDDKYLSAALEGRAEYIISGDHHLLDVKDYAGIKILPPAEFLKLIG